MSSIKAQKYTFFRNFHIFSPIFDDFLCFFFTKHLFLSHFSKKILLFHIIATCHRPSTRRPELFCFLVTYLDICNVTILALGKPI